MNTPETTAPADPILHPAPLPNGSPHLAPPTTGGTGKRAVPPRGSARRRGWGFYLVTGGAAVLLVGGAIAFFMIRPASARPDVLLHKVKKETLNVTVTEK